MSAVPDRHYSLEEYFAFEEASDEKHEYYRGIIRKVGCPEEDLSPEEYALLDKIRKSIQEARSKSEANY